MAVQCELCPRYCVLTEGQSGECRIRVNLKEELIALTYSRPCALHTDPVEKKPLFHFLPGSKILSLATAGCTLHCKNCQNWEISQSNPEVVEAYVLSPREVVETALRESLPSIAYTYTDPVAFYEYALDTCIEAENKGLKNVLVTAAYANAAPFKNLLKYTDAANIDLKAFSERFYKEVCRGSLKPVLDNLVLARDAGIHVEVTNLLIPQMNDTEDEIKALSRWIKENLGMDTPLHFSRFFPRYQMQHLPPTPSATLLKAREIAQAEGIRYVYIGNLYENPQEITFCPFCRKELIVRIGYVILLNHLSSKGVCPQCNHPIGGVWN